MSISFCIVRYAPWIYSLPESQQTKEYFHDQKPIVEDCWDINGIECFPSRIHQNGQNIINSELRHSLSSSDNLIISKPDFFHDYFSKVKIGKGRKHIYTQDMFMKPHYDFKKAPLLNTYDTTQTRAIITEELPHWGTLIVTNDIDRLLIMGKKVVVTPDMYGYSSPDNCYWILMNLHCKHEVTLDFSNKTRQSYSFPIYGYYTGINQVLKTRAGRIPTESPYQSILEYIQMYRNDTSDDVEENIKRMDALISVVDDNECQHIVNQLRNLYGISNKKEDGNYWDSDLSSSEEEEDDDELDEPKLWEKLRLRIQSLEQDFKEEPKPKGNNNQKAFIWSRDGLPKKITEYTVVLSGIYILGDGPEHLCQTDRSLNDFLQNYQNHSVAMHVIPIDNLPENGVFEIQEHYNKKDRGILQPFQDRYHKSYDWHKIQLGQMIDISTEFNDEGEYTPEFKRLVGVLHVQSIDPVFFLVVLQKTMKDNRLFTKNAFRKVFQLLYAK
jgi:hypothetical protein